MEKKQLSSNLRSTNDLEDDELSDIFTEQGYSRTKSSYEEHPPVNKSGKELEKTESTYQSKVNSVYNSTPRSELPSWMVKPNKVSSSKRIDTILSKIPSEDKVVSNAISNIEDLNSLLNNLEFDNTAEADNANQELMNSLGGGAGSTAVTSAASVSKSGKSRRGVQLGRRAPDEQTASKAVKPPAEPLKEPPLKEDSKDIIDEDLALPDEQSEIASGHFSGAFDDMLNKMMSDMPEDPDNPIYLNQHYMDDNLAKEFEKIKKKAFVIDETLPVEKQTCIRCQQPIGNQKPSCRIVTGFWHVEHFTCCICNKSLEKAPFYEVEHEIYCVDDLKYSSSTKCVVCGEGIFEDLITVRGKNYHVNHFKCEECDNVIGDDPYVIKNSKCVCMDCYENKYAFNCGKCLKPIMTNHITVFNQAWHPECFVCSTCGASLEAGQFYRSDDGSAILCAEHYHLTKGTTCESCKMPIIGKFIQSHNVFYHPEHFICNYCQKSLMSQTYKIKNSKSYCLECFNQLV